MINCFKIILIEIKQNNNKKRNENYLAKLFIYMFKIAKSFKKTQFILIMFIFIS